ncbi:hypothetical protein CPAV1605_1076 [seawater metagenome]|uniref:Uncharacterized protein n=1 Tax=seawater metagenome TaxID=1561972 RepID=A0A5E8CLU4_9ZZZZ
MNTIFHTSMGGAVESKNGSNNELCLSDLITKDKVLGSVAILTIILFYLEKNTTIFDVNLSGKVANIEGKQFTCFIAPLIAGFIVGNCSGRLENLLDNLGYQKRSIFYTSLSMIILSFILRKVIEKISIMRTAYDSNHALVEDDKSNFWNKISDKTYTIAGVIMGMIMSKSILYVINKIKTKDTKDIYLYINGSYIITILVLGITLFIKGKPSNIQNNNKLSLLSKQVELLNERYSSN